MTVFGGLFFGGIFNDGNEIQQMDPFLNKRVSWTPFTSPGSHAAAGD
jgi:hypothetical protein